MKKEYFSGWLLILAIGTISYLLSSLVVVAGKQPIEAAVLAIILGISIRSFKLVPQTCEPGVKAFEKILILGIVLIGASLDFNRIAAQGLNIAVIVLVTMSVGFAVTYLLARALKLSLRLALLLAVGTTICGGTAIAVTAPLIDAKEEETSYAIGTIALWGLLALIVYPKIAQFLAVSDMNFGLFAGTAIHSTPQVVGAGFIFSEFAGRTATAIKLMRNCLLAPMSLMIVLWYSSRDKDEENSSTEQKKLNIAKAFPWFLFGYFVMAWANTQGYFSPEVVNALSKSGKFFILLGMVGIGLNTNLAAMKSSGAKPLVVGFLGAIAVAGTSALMISLFQDYF